MSGRRASRQMALQMLYYLDASGDSVTLVFDHFDGCFEPDQKALGFAKDLVEGVWSKREEIDRHIESASSNWRLQRMSRVDRNVLRMGVYELLFSPDVPDKVAINEAVELAKTFGAEESKAFVNGVLDAVRKIARDGGDGK